MPSQRVVAAFFDVSEETVRQWKKQGCPETSAPYDLAEIRRWREARLKRQWANAGTDASKTELERQKLQIDNEHRLLRLRQDAGELVSREETKAEMVRMFHRLRGRLESIPEEIAASVPPALRDEVIATLRHKMRLVCKEIENWGRDNE